MEVLGVAGRGSVTGCLDQLFQGFPVHGLVLEQSDGSPGPEELLGLIPGQDQVSFYLRAVFNVHPGHAQGTVGTDGHAVTACHAIGFINLGNLREALAIYLGYDPPGALGCADSVLFALFFINRQKSHICLHV
jgi:hypothetical protein